MLYDQGVIPEKLWTGGHEVELLICQGERIWPDEPPDTLPPMEVRMANESDAQWLEVGFQSPDELDGSASSGWRDRGGYCVLDLMVTTDLVMYSMGGFVDCDGSPIANEDGTFDYWARAVVPSRWNSVQVDLSVTCDRYGKSITGISCVLSAITLTGFPYAMPADKARLQSDLRAAGFTGATVTSTTAALTAVVINHTVTGTAHLVVTQSGSNVTVVASNGVTIPLPGYPYAMPGQRADLQAALRAAGQSGAVVTLYGDPWTITLLNRLAGAQDRELTVYFTPDDPFPAWDSFGNYQGELTSAYAQGGFSNVRTPDGDPLLEASKQFARLRITAATTTL